MRTAGFCPPLIVTSPTPLICEIFCASVVSARSSTFERARLSELSARVRIGASAGNGPLVRVGQRGGQAPGRVAPRTDVGGEQGGAARCAVDRIDTVHELFSVVDPADAPNGLAIDKGDYSVHVRSECEPVAPAGRTARLDQAVQLNLG